MMLALLVLGQTMNLNVQPLLCLDEGTYCRADRLRAFELNCSGAGITCAQTGGRMTVTVSGGGGGSPTVSCVSGEALSWNGTTWLCVSNVSTATALAADPAACTAGQFVTDLAANGTLTCATPSGGSGSANVVEVDVDFGAGVDSVSVVVTGQTWVTGTSKILCAPTMLATSTRAEGEEDAVIEGLVGAIHSRVAATGFTLYVAPALGVASGVFKFHCTGA